MKQLLDCCPLEGHVIVSCSDHAFVLLKKIKSSGASDDKFSLHELLSHPRIKQSDDIGETIDAVSCFLSCAKKILHCAVTRDDKTISLYAIPTDDDEGVAERILPMFIHKTAKRCCGLVFTQVDTIEGRNETIVLAADLCGDVTAFLVNVCDGDPRPMTKRLMLGHTASMITGIKVVTDGDDKHIQGENKVRQRILTCDRDGKVRLTSFPNTHAIEGYMLNHSSFITSMDAERQPHESCSFCVTSSGDGTIRFWDYSLCKQLAMFRHQGNDEIQNRSKNGMITNVALQYGARTCVYLRDGSFVIHVLNIQQNRSSSPINSSDINFSLIRQYPEFKCSAQPVFAKFMIDKSLLVLMKEPIFLMHLRMKRNTKDGATEFEDISGTSPLCNAIRLAGQKYFIQIPSSIFEFDEFGHVKKLASGLGHSGKKHCQQIEKMFKKNGEQNQKKKRKSPQDAEEKMDKNFIYLE